MVVQRYLMTINQRRVFGGEFAISYDFYDPFNASTF